MPRGKGKIIDKWVFSINKMVVEVPVRMKKGRYDDEPTIFSVSFDHGEHHFWEENADIDELRRATKKWLQDVLTFEYEAFFYVAFSGHVKFPKKRKPNRALPAKNAKQMNEKETGESNSQLEWCLYHVGTTSAGQQMYRDCSGSLNQGQWTHGTPRVGRDASSPFYNWQPAISALVPATPENEQALLQLAKAFDALHKKLTKFLSPELIEQGFANMVAGLPLMLPAMEDEPSPPKKKRRTAKKKKKKR